MPLEVDIDLLAPNPRQPRVQIDQGPLEELAQSIRVNGIIQPILVRKAGDRYEIIAGERRWRAAQTRRAPEGAGDRPRDRRRPGCCRSR